MGGGGIDKNDPRGRVNAPTKQNRQTNIRAEKKAERQTAALHETHKPAAKRLTTSSGH